MSLFENHTTVTPEQLRKFVGNVVKMRVMQKAYFKTRDKYILNDAKKLEKEVDAMIEKLNEVGWE